MNITLLTYGSRGDVEPFIALANGLIHAGHRVNLAAPESFSKLLKNDQISYFGLPGDPQQMVENLVHRAGKNSLRMITSLADFVLPLAVEVMNLVRTACREVDLIIHSFLLTSTGYEIARELGIPDISVQFFPVFTTTGEFPAPTFPDLPLGDSYRRLTHQLVTGIFWRGSRFLYRRIQTKNADLPDLTAWPFNPDNTWQTPILYAFSPQVISRPRDWREGVSITGYWFLDDLKSWSPDQELINFIGEGDPPVAVAFGNSSSLDMDRVYQKIIKALTLSNQRGILVGANPDLQGIPPSVFQVDNVPYQWLFKLCAAVIHHGGAGTTGQGLAAGVPNIVLPFTSDQPFWARRVFKLEVGPEPLSPRRFTSQQLAEQIKTAISDPHLKKNAQKIGAAIREEDGVAQAVNLIQRVMNMKTRFKLKPSLSEKPR